VQTYGKQDDILVILSSGTTAKDSILLILL